MNLFIYLLITKLIVFATNFHATLSFVDNVNELETPIASSLNLVRPKRNLANSTVVEQKPVKLKLTNEKRLIKDLLDNYQVKWGRPVNNMSEKVVVYFGINLVQLLDMVSGIVQFLFIKILSILF